MKLPKEGKSSHWDFGESLPPRTLVTYLGNFYMQRQWCAAQSVKTNSLGEANDCRVCWFLWYQFSYMANFRLPTWCHWTEVGKRCRQLALVRTNWFQHITGQRPLWNRQQTQESPLGKYTNSFHQLLTVGGSLREHSYLVFISPSESHLPYWITNGKIAKMMTWDFGSRAALVPFLVRALLGQSTAHCYLPAWNESTKTIL